MSLTVYTKDNCPQCDLVKSLVKMKASKHDISFITFDEINENSMEIITSYGIRQAPAIINHETKTSYTVEELASLLDSL